MATFNFSASQKIDLLKFGIINSLILSGAIILMSPQIGMAQINRISTQDNRTIKGQSGGSTDSQGCGFIAASPNYKMNLEERIDYMRLTVRADGGQPTLLVLGPNSEDSFCVLGDEISGLKPEISGVWEAGNYEVYVGDRSGGQHQFVLDISTNN